jgi:hypothetical protein
MWKIGVVAAISLAIAPAQAGHHRVARIISEVPACTRWGPSATLHLSSAGLGPVFRQAHVCKPRDYMFADRRASCDVRAGHLGEILS